MNLYFIVEGLTESKVYKRWIPTLLKGWQEISVLDFDKVDKKNFVIFQGSGFPQIINHIKHAIKDINSVNKYSHLIICIDSEKYSVDEKKDFVEKRIMEHECSAEVIPIIAHRCIETWFLGNKALFLENSHKSCLGEYIQHFNVSADDPEAMSSPIWFRHKNSSNRDVAFHQNYFQKMCPRYSKSNPHQVANEDYLNNLIKRVEENKTHLKSFQKLLSILHQIKNI